MDPRPPGTYGRATELRDLVKLATAYIAILDDEWDEMPDDERRDLLGKIKDVIERLRHFTE